MNQDGTAHGPLLSIVNSVGLAPTTLFKSLLASRSSLSCTAHPPSRTSAFLRCPRLWHYERSWTEKGTWTPHILIGHAIHAGIEREIQNFQSGHHDLDPLNDIALPMLADQWQETPEWEHGAVQQKLVKAWPKIVSGSGQKLIGTGVLIGTEVCLDHSYAPHEPIPGKCAIADLVTQEPDGLIITDHKTKWAMDSKWIDKELRRTEVSWQLHDYAWRAMVKYQKPVKMVRQNLLIVTPTPKAHVMEVVQTQEKLWEWYLSARKWWTFMDVCSDTTGHPAARPPQNFEACLDYGGCRFHTACHSLDGDESQFPAFYSQK